MIGRIGSNFEYAPLHGWSLAGFDIGYFESEWSHYSAILNEVLFGRYDELRTFAGRLNEHLLVATVELGLALIKERHRLLAMGRDLEQEPPSMEPIVVRVRPRM
jgi:hypothetical protein